MYLTLTYHSSMGAQIRQFNDVFCFGDDQLSTVIRIHNNL